MTASTSGLSALRWLLRTWRAWVLSLSHPSPQCLHPSGFSTASLVVFLNLEHRPSAAWVPALKTCDPEMGVSGGQWFFSTLLWCKVVCERRKDAKAFRGQCEQGHLSLRDRDTVSRGLQVRRRSLTGKLEVLMWSPGGLDCAPATLPAALEAAQNPRSRGFVRSPGRASGARPALVCLSPASWGLCTSSPNPSFVCVCVVCVSLCMGCLCLSASLFLFMCYVGLCVSVDRVCLSLCIECVSVQFVVCMRGAHVCVSVGRSVCMCVPACVSVRVAVRAWCVRAWVWRVLPLGGSREPTPFGE